jgi:ABC-type glycerol-3-phosphate transport system substrate-binding protein
MKKTYQRRSWSLVVLLCMAVMLVGFSSVATAQEKTKIVFAYWGTSWSRDHDILTAKNRFEAQYPQIEVELLEIPGSSANFVQQLKIYLAAGMEIDAATVMASMDGSFIPFFDDITSLMARDNIKPSLFLPGSLESLTLGNTIWGLPISVVLRGGAYNARMLAEIGYAPPAALDWTWDTMQEVAKKGTLYHSANSEPSRYGIDMAGAPNVFYLYGFGTHAGANFFDRFVDPSKTAWNTPEARQTIDFFLSFFENKWAALRTGTFQSNKAVFTIDSVPRSAQWIEERFGHQDIEFIPMPKGPVKGGFHQGTHAVELVKTSKNKEATWTWMKYLATSLTEIEARYKAPQRVDPHMSALREAAPLYLSTGRNLVAKIESWVTIAGHPDNTPRYVIRNGAQITSVAQAELLAVVNKQQPVESAIERIQQQVQALLDDAFRQQ